MPLRRAEPVWNWRANDCRRPVEIGVLAVEGLLRRFEYECARVRRRRAGLARRVRSGRANMVAVAIEVCFRGAFSESAQLRL